LRTAPLHFALWICTVKPYRVEGPLRHRSEGKRASQGGRRSASQRPFPRSAGSGFCR
jgi:hypothetical protein